MDLDPRRLGEIRDPDHGADNHSEGGIVALLALLDVRHARHGSWRASLWIIGLIGAALLYGDGVITPAISVLSALER